MTTSGSLLAHTRAWMERNGWLAVSEGPAGWMMQSTTIQHEGRRIALVRDLDDDEFAFEGVVRRLAQAHQTPATSLDRALRMWGTDVTVLRAANDFVITDTIPLSAGATILESARVMFRSAATTSLRLRAEIAGSYSKIGDEVCESIRMGHTARGSYLIPVYIPIGEPKSVGDAEPSIPGMDRESLDLVESPERRMTRTFSEAMQAIQAHVLQPEGLPKSDQVHELVSSGVTREFISALSRVLTEDAVAEFEAKFEWAPSQKAPARAPGSVTVPAASREKLETTARALKKSAKVDFHVLSGPIVTVTKHPDDTTVYATIKTIRRGRQCSVEAVLRNTSLEDVTRWMKDSETVRLEGVVARHGQTLRVSHPDAFGPATLFKT